jgi:acetyl esterase/lipase
VIDHAKELAGDPARVFVSGHSAGGHLTTMSITDARVAGGIAISGIYDLEPIRLSYRNDKAPARRRGRRSEQSATPSSLERGRGGDR